MCPVITIFGVKIFTFSCFLSLAWITCLCFYNLSKKYDKFFKHSLYRSFIYSLIGAVTFGKLFYFITQICKKDISLLERFGGFVFYGGFCGMMLGLLYYTQKNKMIYEDYLDIYLSILPLGQAIGRIGCFFNGCCYGKEYNGAISVSYTINGIETRVFPTWFIESVFCLGIFCVFFINTKPLYSGSLSALYMISYSLYRFIIEFFRGDDARGIFCRISFSQYVSVVIFIFGLYMLLKSNKEKRLNYLFNE